MTAVALPALVETLTSTGPGTTPATADPAADFSELLSTLASLGTVRPAFPSEGVQTLPTPIPESSLAGANTPEPPTQNSSEVAPLTALPSDPRKAVDRPQEVEADQSLKEPERPPLPAAALSLAIAGQPIIEAGNAPIVATLVGSVRSTRLRAEEKEPRTANPRDERPAEPAEWTMQQALAAVAAIAAPATPPVPVPAIASSKQPIQEMTAPATSPAVLPIASGRLAKAQPAAPAPALEGPASSEALVSKAGPSSATPLVALPIDPQVFAAAIGHARAAAITPHATAGENGAALSSTALDLHQLDALVRDIAAVSGTSGRAAFRLTADQLGPMEVRLHTSEAGVAVTIRTHDETSRTTVTQAQQQLTEDMRANGLKVAATNVMLGGGGADRQRQDRPSAPAPRLIEVAASEREQSLSSDEPRPDGRYA